MQPSKLSVFELFEKERRYVLPVFQRPYVWKQGEQWAPLWDDVRETANRALAYARGEGEMPRTHFLGAVVLSQLPTFGRQVNASDIVDGQQRLTTLQVLLAAMRDVARTLGDDGLDQDFRRLTLNTCRMDDAAERFKVWPTTVDRQAFEDVLTAESPAEVEARFPLVTRRYQRQPDPRHRIADAYLYFYARVNEYVAGDAPVGGDGADPEGADMGVPGGGAVQERLDALLDALTKYMELVVIELEGDDDPQVIFESLNGRGAPLLPSDLVRNFVFLEASRADPTGVEALYDATWADYDVGEGGAFWKEEVRQGRITRPRIDLFLFHYVTARTARDTRITHLYQEFRRWWTSEPRDVAVELARLGEYAEAFARMSSPPPDSASRYDVFARRLGALDTSTVYPVLLHLAVTEGFTDAQMDRVGEAIESFLVRRMVCGLTSKNYNRLFLGLLQHLHETDAPTPETVTAYLMSGTGESVQWPSDTMFAKEWASRPAYGRVNQGRVRLVLEALDRALVGHRQEGLALPAGLTIEHVLPQSANVSDWPYPSESASDGVAEDARAQLLHTFGNLTLLTQSLNSSVSNGPFSAKRPAIAAQSQLPLNAYFQRFDNGDRWTEVEIGERGKELFASALAVWPRASAGEAVGATDTAAPPE